MIDQTSGPEFWHPEPTPLTQVSVEPISHAAKTPAEVWLNLLPAERYEIVFGDPMTFDKPHAPETMSMDGVIRYEGQLSPEQTAEQAKLATTLRDSGRQWLLSPPTPEGAPVQEPAKLRKAVHMASQAIRAVTNPENYKKAGHALRDAVSPENIKKTAHNVKELGPAGAALGFEFAPPTNEGSRYGALILTEAVSHRNPVLGGLAFAASTLLVEGAGVWGLTKLMATDKANKLTTKLHSIIYEYVPEDAKLSLPVKGAIATFLGAASLTAVTQVENPKRPIEKARRQGYRAVAALVGLCAVEGTLLSEGAHDLVSPQGITAGLLGVAALVAAPKWAKRRLAGLSQGPEPIPFMRSNIATEVEEQLSPSQQLRLDDGSVAS